MNIFLSVSESVSHTFALEMCVSVSPPVHCAFLCLPPFYISSNPLKFFCAERALGPIPIMLVGSKITVYVESLKGEEGRSPKNLVF